MMYIQVRAHLSFKSLGIFCCKYGLADDEGRVQHRSQEENATSCVLLSFSEPFQRTLTNISDCQWNYSELFDCCLLFTPVEEWRHALLPDEEPEDELLGAALVCPVCKHGRLHQVSEPQVSKFLGKYTPLL